MALIPGFVLCERFLAHQERVLDAERRALRRLEEEMVDRVAAHERLQAEMVEGQRLEREVLEVAERERRDVGYELHDGTCQMLTGARLRRRPSSAGPEADLRVGFRAARVVALARASCDGAPAMAPRAWAGLRRRSKWPETPVRREQAGVLSGGRLLFDSLPFPTPTA